MDRGKTHNCESCASAPKSFDTLNSKELNCISDSKNHKVFKKGEVIFHEGNRPTGVYCLQEGKVKIFKNGIDGRKQIVRLAKPGDLIGYRSFLGEDLYTASAAAIEESKACFIERDSFFSVLKANTEFSWQLIQNLTRELRDAENLVRDMAQKSVRERLAEILLILKEKYGTNEAEPGLLNAKLSREELANFVGTATETLIRLLSDFKAQGLITTKGKNITILDAEELIKTANIEY
ncbi:MAG: Crp/Fnr family transcriptional regulator [Deltaproteobacteria bacterium]|nr:Crp/Fnr family transcriptional regulator [Deltaproteobacteria bacterium]